VAIATVERAYANRTFDGAMLLAESAAGAGLCARRRDERARAWCHHQNVRNWTELEADSARQPAVGRAARRINRGCARSLCAGTVQGSTPLGCRGTHRWGWQKRTLRCPERFRRKSGKRSRRRGRGCPVLGGDPGGRVPPGRHETAAIQIHKSDQGTGELRSFST
jgi:hypothetical protein